MIERGGVGFRATGGRSRDLPFVWETEKRGGCGNVGVERLPGYYEGSSSQGRGMGWSVMNGTHARQYPLCSSFQ